MGTQPKSNEWTCAFLFFTRSNAKLKEFEDKAIVIDSPNQASLPNSRVTSARPQTSSQVQSQVKNNSVSSPEALLRKLKEKAAIQFPDDKSKIIYLIIS